MSAASEGAALVRQRDPRLDVFRGLGMFIILYAHIPQNPWSELIPARFGFSDATEIFVFCSGMASALAFGRAFDRAGVLRGTAKVAQRLWQVYWAHVASFVAIVATLAAVDAHLGGGDYVGRRLNLWPLLADPAHRLSELLTLTYVPNFFDILPMYLVILAMIPAVMMLERLAGGRVVIAASAALWLVAILHCVELPAERWGAGRPWFFNPFAWQALFFLGFGFVRGWYAAPRRAGWTVAAAVAVLVLAAPFSCHRGWSCYAGYGLVPWLGAAHESIAALTDKTHLGPFRIVHFLALAYLAVVAAGHGGARLRRLPGVGLVSAVGRQTLAVFLAGLWLAQLSGVVLDQIGRSAAAAMLVNGGASLLLLAVALVVGWIKGQPWSARRPVGIGQPAPAGATADLAGSARA